MESSVCLTLWSPHQLTARIAVISKSNSAESAHALLAEHDYGHYLSINMDLHECVVSSRFRCGWIRSMLNVLCLRGADSGILQQDFFSEKL